MPLYDVSVMTNWYPKQVSNLRQSVCRTGALPTELFGHNWHTQRGLNPRLRLERPANVPLFHGCINLVERHGVEPRVAFRASDLQSGGFAVSLTLQMITGSSPPEAFHPYASGLLEVSTGLADVTPFTHGNLKSLAGEEGFEPPTFRLTAGRSAAELYPIKLAPSHGFEPR